MKIGVWMHSGRICSIRWSTINANFLLLQPAFQSLMSCGIRDYHWANGIIWKQLQSAPGTSFTPNTTIANPSSYWHSIKLGNFGQQFLYWFHSFMLTANWKAIQYKVIPWKWLFFFFFTHRLISGVSSTLCCHIQWFVNLYSDHLALACKNSCRCPLSTTACSLGSRHLAVIRFNINYL